MNSINKNILVACNDAGGANILACFVKANQSKFNFICLVSGPAVKIFKDKGIKIKEDFSTAAETLLSNFKRLSLVLTGSSWSVKREIEFILAARKYNIPSVTFIDHWVNFKERFGFPRKDWQSNLPDEIWTGDRYAYDLAKEFFKKQDIKLKKNWYFKEVRERYDKLRQNKKTKADKILLVSEPFAAAVNYHGDKKLEKQSELNIIDTLLENFVGRQFSIILRLHPSEKAKKYQKIINKYKNSLDIEISANRDPLIDLVRSKYVIGMESAFLVLAVLCGKKTFSYIPGNAYKCSLPFKQVIKIKNLNKLIRIIK